MIIEMQSLLTAALSVYLYLFFGGFFIMGFFTRSARIHNRDYTIEMLLPTLIHNSCISLQNYN
jgi:hypothetical protein